MLNSIKNTSVTYQSLPELVTALIEEELASYNEIFHSIEIPIEAFENFCSWSDECYTRNCIVENEKFELILLCWEKGQKTPIHDHGGEECWVKVLKGTFKETIYKKDDTAGLKEISCNTSNVSDVSYMIDFMGFHSLENHSDGRAMSLHLYAKPIKNCSIFNPHTKVFLPKDLSYCTVSETIKK